MTFPPGATGETANPTDPSASSSADSGLGKPPEILIDAETVELINKLARKQGISPATALKKALVEVDYLYGAKERGGSLFVERKDKSIAKIAFSGEQAGA